MKVVLRVEEEESAGGCITIRLLERGSFDPIMIYITPCPKGFLVEAYESVTPAWLWRREAWMTGGEVRALLGAILGNSKLRERFQLVEVLVPRNLADLADELLPSVCDIYKQETPA